MLGARHPDRIGAFSSASARVQLSGDIGRVDSSGGIQASLPGRYATALFDLAREGKAIETVEASLATLDAAMAESPDLKRLVASPLVSRDAAAGAIKAVGGELQLDQLTINFLGVLATNRRLRTAPAVIAAFRAMAANYRGETSADVTTAHPLTDDQTSALKAKLKTRIGRDVAIHTKIDPSILGGLIVRIGSQMIDASIATKLNTLALAMKG